MKIAILSAFAAAGAIGIAYSETAKCDLATIKTTLMANTTISEKLTTATSKCKNDTGVDIFDITSFPTKATALAFQQSNDGCNVAINLVTSNANINTQCTIPVNGTDVVYGQLVSGFLAGHTGNESDSGSGSVEIPSSSASGSESSSGSSNSSSNSTTTSDAATTALSFVTYGAIAAIAVALG